MSYALARMLSVYVLVAGVLSATYAAAIVQYLEHRSSRKSEIHMSVRPKYLNMRRGDSFSVLCRAKGGREVDDIPMITFYRQLSDRQTVMPLSSSSYGVSITTSRVKPERRSRSEERRMKSYVFKHGRGRLRTTKVLHLRREIYNILDPGSNFFYCRATTIGGAIYDEPFVINRL